MANCFELDLPQYKQSLRDCCGFLDNLQFSAVKTKKEKLNNLLYI